MTDKVKEPVETAQDSKSVSEESEKKYLVLGNNFGDSAKYEEFFNNINTNSAFQVLISAINFAQRKGAYNIEECSLIDKSIKTILKESEKVNADKNSK
jgi:hypothetical protein